MSHRSITNTPHKAVLTGMARFAAASILLVSLAGCSLIPSQVAPQQVAPQLVVPSSGEGIYGTGEKVDTATGTFEQVKMNPNDPVYKYNDGQGQHPDFMSQTSWSVEDATAAQKLAVDYVGNEFLNSSALENGQEGFDYWYVHSAGNYFSQEIMYEVAGDPGETHILLGNFGEKPLIPALIHDGSPRVKDVKLSVSEFRPHESNPTNSVKFTVAFDAGYRVNDANAAAIVGAYTGMTGEEVINSKYAKDSLKDGVGENVYRGKGYANVIVTKEASGMKIVGFESKADFDTRDFANQDLG